METITNLQYIKKLMKDLDEKYSKNQIEGFDSTIGQLFLRDFLPYGIEQKGILNNYYIVNRNYQLLCKINLKGSDGIFFYNDSNTPWINKENLNIYLGRINYFLENIEN